jgi:hypothetical protein
MSAGSCRGAMPLFFYVAGHLTWRPAALGAAAVALPDRFMQNQQQAIVGTWCWMRRHLLPPTPWT